MVVYDTGESFDEADTSLESLKQFESINVWYEYLKPRELSSSTTGKKNGGKINKRRR